MLLPIYTIESTLDNSRRTTAKQVAWRVFILELMEPLLLLYLQESISVGKMHSIDCWRAPSARSNLIGSSMPTTLLI